MSPPVATRQAVGFAPQWVPVRNPGGATYLLGVHKHVTYHVLQWENSLGEGCRTREISLEGVAPSETPSLPEMVVPRLLGAL